MDIHDRISTGLPGLDHIIDKLRLGDNVVWKVDSISNYKKMVGLYVKQAISDSRNIIYVRFGFHEPLLDESLPVKTYNVKAEKGFEAFATEVYSLVAREGEKAFYVFDCLTDLLEYWHSDIMINNFFKIMCPFLYELDTVAYFAIIRNVHTFSTIASIRETTQLLLDLFEVQEKVYLHPLKVWKRYTSTMFLPHLLQDNDIVSITSSSESAGLFSKVIHNENRQDYWYAMFEKAKDSLNFSADEQENVKRKLMPMLIDDKSKMFPLCDRYFALPDILALAEKEIGTGFIGGKSVGMLTARKALESEGAGIAQVLEPHDSFYIGSDVFYTYIVQNGWWELRTKQKTKDGYYKYASELREKISTGKFPEETQQQFIQMLEYFGQSPIIVRSSSLLEDNYGNAFSGKYESVFCVNQGTPEERYNAFEQAVRTVYASTMNEDALSYRMSRGLEDADEQMAILVQRVSGDYYGENFFPHIAGVGNSKNLYVWDQSIDMDAGMLRLVFGLGTRAVDRTTGDYVRIVCLDDPARLTPMDYSDISRYSQHHIDLLALDENILTEKPLEEVFAQDIRVDKTLFIQQDLAKMNRMRELGISSSQPSYILDFKNLLSETGFPSLMKDTMAVLSRVYDYPVDIEFTANFKRNGSFTVNLLQCRPLQTRGIGQTVKIPSIKHAEDCFFSTSGNFMGGNVHLSIDFVVMVDTEGYLKLTEQEKYTVARQIGRVNAALKGWNILLVGPGRWGTTTPSIGVPVRFSEICNMSVICEVADEAAGFIPELSYGSHFFQDLVEMQIFYAAIFGGSKDVIYNPKYFTNTPDMIRRVFEQKDVPEVVHIYKPDKLELFSDIMSQKVLCK